METEVGEKSESVISIWTQLSAAVPLLLFKREQLFGSLVFFKARYFLSWFQLG